MTYSKFALCETTYQRTPDYSQADKSVQTVGSDANIETVNPQVVRDSSQYKMMKDFLRVAMESATPMVPPVSPGQLKKGLVNLNSVVAALSIEQAMLDFDFYQERDEQHILGCLKTILELFVTYGFDFEKHLLQMTATIRKSLKLAMNSGLHWMKYFKTRIADFFAYWNNQELSTYPNYGIGKESPGYFFGGAAYMFTRRLMDGPHAFSFSASILMSKKGMPRATESMVRKAEADNIKIMTTPKPAVPEFKWVAKHVYKTPGKIILENREVSIGKKETQEQIHRTIFELFTGKHQWKFGLMDMSAPTLPSASSNYNRTRTKQGTYGEIVLTKSWPIFAAAIAGILGYELKETTLFEYVSEYYGEKGRIDVEDTEGLEKVSLGLAVHTVQFEIEYRKFYWGLVNEAMAEKPLVEVVGLVEALKIRCISKGPPLTYFVLKTLQMSLHSHLRKNPIFQLIGEPITTELMNKRFRKFLGKEIDWHSGDYSAATDGLFSWCSETAAEAINEVFKLHNGFDMGPVFELFLRSLTGHIYVSPDEETQTILEIPQERGQLMGSITSFPILCILNLALMRKALEIAEGKVIPLHKFPGWVNGDDCLTPYTRGNNFPIIWEKLAAQFGFEKSLGKTYDSPEFCSMNSHTFRKCPFGGWELVPYVNLGLIHAQKRSMTKGTQETNPSELGTLHHQLMDTCPPHLRRSLTEFFLYRHETALKRFDGPWFLPKYMGGLGLKNQESYTDEDRHYGYHALREANVNPVRFAKEKEWMHFDLFNEVVEDEGNGMVTPYFFKKYEHQDTYPRAFVAIIYVEGWVRLGLKGLYNPQKSEEDKVYNSIQAFTYRVRRRIEEERKSGRYNRLTSDESFVGEPKKTCLPVYSI